MSIKNKVKCYLTKMSTVSCRFVVVGIQLEKVNIQHITDFQQNIGINPLVVENAIDILP